MLDALDETAGLKDATDIILSGVSAGQLYNKFYLVQVLSYLRLISGGIGVWMNVDYLAARYPNARVTAATIAGYYFYATYYQGPNHTEAGTMADFREEAWPSTYTLYQAYVDADCQEFYEAKGESPGNVVIS